MNVCKDWTFLKSVAHHLWVLPLLFHPSAVVAQSTTVQAVVANLPSANKKLQETFKSYRGTGIATDVGNYDTIPEQTKEDMRKRGKEVPTGLRLNSRKRLEFFVDGPNRKVTVEILESADEDTARKKPDEKPLRKMSLRLGSQGASWLEWRGEDREPIIKSISKDGDRETLMIGNEFDSFLKMIHSLPMGSLSDLLANPDFKITGVKDVPGKDGSQVQLQFEYQTMPRIVLPPRKATNPAKMRFVGTVTLDPKLGWAIREYEYHNALNAERSEFGTVEYDESRKDAPIPVKFTTDARHQRMRELKIESLALGPVPSAEFAAESGGLPRAGATPEAIETESAGRAWWWIGLGVLVLVAGLWLRFRPRKRPTLPQAN